MMRSLWTAASGMMSQQTSVDTIANNLANVNTVGYKQEQTQFKSLLYQNLQAKTTSANGANSSSSAKPEPAKWQVRLSRSIYSLPLKSSMYEMKSSGVIAVGLADEPDGIRQQDVALRFLRFVFLPLFVFLVCDLLHGGYLIKRVLSLPFSYICCILYCFG